MKTITLRPERERSLRRRHPWVFAGSIAKGGADAGETVKVVGADGSFLAWAAYSPASQIRLRAWSFDEAERIDASLFQRRIAAAVAWRTGLATAGLLPSTGQRLVHGEGDGLPGLVVDRYGDVLCLQLGSAGAERWREAIVDALVAATGITRVYERSDAAARGLEGLAERSGWLRGEGDTALQIDEHGWRFGLDVALGHKTGFYLDQRDSRLHFSRLVRQLGCETVLNCFAYTGGFSVAALAGGAKVVETVDSSAPALLQARANLRANGVDDAAHAFIDADVNAHLRRCLAEGRRFDAIVLDPPKFAPTAAHAERAARAYKDINRLALQLLAPGGLLTTFSCSGGVDAALFHKIVAGAAIDADVDAALAGRLQAAPDHPTVLTFPEGDYLKGLLLRRR